MSLSEKLFYNFSRLFHCSIIKVLAICFRLESLIFPRKTDCFLCFRFVVSLPRQQILSYQIISCLSTLFLTFLFRFSKSLSRQRVISYQTVRRLSTLFFIFFKIINFIYNSDDISNVSSFPCLCCNIPYSEFDIPPRRICKCRQSFDSVSDDNNTTHGSQLSNIFPVSSCSPVNSALSI